MQDVQKEFQMRVCDPKVQAFLTAALQKLLSSAGNLTEARRVQEQRGVLKIRVVLQHSIAGVFFESKPSVSPAS